MPEVNPVANVLHAESLNSKSKRFSVCSSSSIKVTRKALTVARKNENCSYEAPQPVGLRRRFKEHVVESCTCTRESVAQWIVRRFPIITWLSIYDIKNWLVPDIIAGSTVAIIHIPQGMAYALLAHLPPICGIYMGFFHSLFYLFLGTSRHCSMGSFAVSTIMTGQVVMELATFPPKSAEDSVTTIASNFTDDFTTTAGYNFTEAVTDAVTMSPAHPYGAYSPQQVAAVVCFMAGVWQILIGFFQLGNLSVYLSDMIVSGFTTAAAFHVVTTQIKYVFGVKIPKFAGPFRAVYTYIAVAKALPTTNITTFIMSAITIVVLFVNNEIGKPIVAKYTRIPVPVELLAVIFGTVSSYFLNFKGDYGVEVVGLIPPGLPPPVVAPLALLPKVITSSLIIGIITYTVSFSLGKIFAKPHGYTVDPTQEFYAMGIGNVLSSFWPCCPMAAAIARTTIQDAVGGVTQMASIVSCTLLALVLYFVGPILEELPTAILASIIIVAMKRVLMQTKDMIAMWSVSKIEAIMWMVTFFTVVLIDFDIGVLAGVVFSIIVLLSKNQKPSITKLGRVPATDIYLDMEAYNQAKRIPGVSVLRVTGAIHFASREHLRNKIYSETGLDPAAIQKMFEVMKKKHPEIDIDIEKIMLTDFNETTTYNLEISHDQVRYIVLDLSGIRYVDTTGGKIISAMRADYERVGICLCLAGLPENVSILMEKCGAMAGFKHTQLFHSIHDAVVILTSPKKRKSLHENDTTTQRVPLQENDTITQRM